MPGKSLLSLLIGSLGVTLCLVAVGCSASANDAPIIDYVESPLVVTAENGAYQIPITIGFHDLDEEVVTRVRYRVSPSIDRIVEIPRPIPTRQSAEVTLLIPAHLCGPSAGADRSQLEITIIDGRGAESLVLPRPVTFE